MSSWYVYMVECADGSYYTGVTTDVSRRVCEHNGVGTVGKGAKYTQARRPVRLVYSEVAAGRGAAQEREHALRQLNRRAKEELAKQV
jgi:putative endonuclease